jgi:hypothetical protein
MISRLAIGAILFMLTGCGLSSLPHGNLPMPDTIGGPGFGSSPFTGQHQQEQLNDSGPDLSHMSCSGSSSSSSGTNAGTFSSSASCHN